MRRQEKTIKRVEYFIPDNIKHLGSVAKADLIYYRLAGIQESVDGIDSKQAFLDYSNKGIKPSSITSLREFLNLLIGLSRMTLQMELWAEGFREGTLLLLDFENEPTYIQELAEKAEKNSKGDRYDYIKNLSWNGIVLGDYIKNISSKRDLIRAMTVIANLKSRYANDLQIFGELDNLFQSLQQNPLGAAK